VAQSFSGAGPERKKLLAEVKSYLDQGNLDAASARLAGLLSQEGTPGKAVQRLMQRIEETRHDLGLVLLEVALSKGPPADKTMYERWLSYAREQGITDDQIHVRINAWADDLGRRVQQEIDVPANRMRLKKLQSLKAALAPEKEPPAPARQRRSAEEMSVDQHKRLQRDTLDQREHGDLPRD